MYRTKMSQHLEEQETSALLKANDAADGMPAWYCYDKCFGDIENFGYTGTQGLSPNGGHCTLKLDIEAVEDECR
jgi:hypothetical protein